MIWCSDGAIVFEIQNLFHYRCIDVQNSREFFLFEQKENQKLKLKGDMAVPFANHILFNFFNNCYKYLQHCGKDVA